MNLKMNYLTLALAVTLLGFAPQSSSAVSITNDGSTVTGIQDLFIGGVFYNVTFPLTTPNDFYGPAPSFTFQWADATAASTAVQRVIDTLFPTAFTSVGESSSLQSPQFFVGYDDSTVQPGSIDTKNGRYNDISDRWLNVSGVEFIPYNDPRHFADFQAVPEPSTAALMTLGLIGLAARRRRP